MADWTYKQPLPEYRREKMRVIMMPPTKDQDRVKSWVLKELVAGYQLVDYKDEKELRDLAGAIELDFEMQLGKEQVEWPSCLAEFPVILVTIGARQESHQVSSYYEMTEGHLEKIEVADDGQLHWLCCYSPHQVRASHLITTIKEVLHQIRQLHLRAIIYLDVESKSAYFYYRSLTYKLINDMLGEEDFMMQVRKKEDRAACYLPTQKFYEPYQNKFLYGDSYEQLIYGVARQLANNREEKENDSLYNDFFYQCLEPETKFYLPLVKGWENEEDHLTHLNKVSWGKGHYAIYDTKANIEAQKSHLKTYVPNQFTVPLAAQIPLYKSQEDKKQEESLFKGSLHYKGEDVYIGIITTERIQLESPLLRTQDGSTRISCLWQQQEADRGSYYTSVSINKLLAYNNLKEEEKSDATYLLELAGGKYKHQEALASKANFLVAEIKPASPGIQAIYTGEIQPSTVCVADLLIATYKLLELARLNQKPLVLYLPYFYLLTTENGKNSYDRLLEQLSDEPGLTMIIPAGEEADKRHHLLIRERTGKAFIETNREQQSIVGVINTEDLTSFKVQLQLEKDKKERVLLDQKGTYKTKAGVVETSGLMWDATSGGFTLRFRILQQIKTRWELTFESQESKSLRLSMSLREMALDTEVMLDTYSVLATANVAPSKWSAIGVGSFDTKALVTIGGSGRVETSHSKRLTLAAQGKGSVRDPYTNVLYYLEGSAVAASLVTATVATLYSKWQKEKGRPYPNTHMMKAWLEQLLIRIPQQDNPHISQGKGILEFNRLASTLIEPLE